MDGKRIQENIKKHKRNDQSHYNKRPYKRRKLNNKKLKSKPKSKPKTKPKSKIKCKPKIKDNIEYEIEEGEDDPYGGLPYHFHLATHCEPKFIPSNVQNTTDIKTLLNLNNNTMEMNESKNRNNNENENDNACKLYAIEYYNANNYLDIELSDSELELTDQLIVNYNNIMNEMKEIDESDNDNYNYGHGIINKNIYVNNGYNDINDDMMNDIIINDLKQYHFITNAINPTPTPPPINTNVNINVINSKKHKIQQPKKPIPPNNYNIPVPVPVPMLPPLNNGNNLPPPISINMTHKKHRNNNNKQPQLSLPTLNRNSSGNNGNVMNGNNIKPLAKLLSSRQIQSENNNANNLSLINMININDIRVVITDYAIQQMLSGDGLETYRSSLGPLIENSIWNYNVTNKSNQNNYRLRNFVCVYFIFYILLFLYVLYLQ